MTDPSQPRPPAGSQAPGPTQEELEAHLAQLREANVAEVVVQAVNMLATGAQVKLGRDDARVLIDAIAAIADTADGRVDAELVKQVRDAVSQLKMAQVQAERDLAQAEATSTQGQTEAEQSPTGQGETGQNPPLTDRLWIPGREPGAS
jgi:hypothetical protein